MAIGSTLRNARIQRGLTIEQVAQDTRISARFLDALEAESFDDLPAPVYVRGFLRSYANYLRLDPQPLLNELAKATGAPVAGPDAFVEGPTSRQPARPANDPFRRMPPPVAAPAPVEDDGEEEWAPEPVAAGPGPERFGGEPGPALRTASDGEVYRPRRVAGVLTEREAQYNESSGGMRILALAGGALIVVFFVVAVAVLLNGGGDNGPSNAPAGLDAETPTVRPATVVAVGSATALPSATASPSVSVTPGSPTPSGTPTPASPTATPTKAPAGNPPPPPTVTPTPTPTPETPTPTPRPPTPTVTPVPTHPIALQECQASLSCGPPPLRVVCPPDGTWFVDRPDVNGTFPAESYGWKVVTVQSAGTANLACY